MQVKTKSMGTVEIQEKQIIKIPEGLIGFEEYTEYALIESEYKPFIWLQSLQEEKLAFLLVDPFIVLESYEADIDDKELDKIGIKNPADVVLLVTVTVPLDGSPLTANLQGPLVINKANNVCMQAVLDGNRWTTKFNILENIKKQEGK